MPIRPHVRHRKTVESLRASAIGLPPRLSLFGHTRLAATDIELLDALSVNHELHLWLPHPSDALWRALSGTRGQGPRVEDVSHQHAGHPLLATLGRDLRELQRRLPTAGRDRPETSAAYGLPDTLLGWLQSDLHANAVRPGTRTLAPTTAPCRCTAVTARPARSTCCARCCSACSPTTRRSNRATFW